MLRFFRFGDGRLARRRVRASWRATRSAAPAEVARRLGCGTGEQALRLKRLRSVGDQPASVRGDLAAAAVVRRGWPRATLRGWGDLLYPLFAERCGVHVHRAVDTIGFGSLAAAQARALRLPAGHPCARVQRQAFDLAGPLRRVAHHARRCQRLPLHRLHHLRTPMTRPPLFTRRRLLAAGAACWPCRGGRAFAAGDIAGGKPITLLVSYPAGGGADVMARLIAPRMAEALGQPVVVENKPGASGTIAAAQVARATPDGSTLLLDASSFAVNPALFDKLPYDTATAFAPLAVLALYPNALVCTPSFEARTVADVLRLARAQPGKLAYASSGNGSAQHLAGALFEAMAKVEPDPCALPRRRPGAERRDGRAGAALLCQCGFVAGAHPVGSAAARWRSLPACVRACCPTCRRWTRPASRATRCSNGTRCWRRPACPRRCAPRSRRPSARRWPTPRCWAACARSAARSSAAARPRPRASCSTQQALWARVVRERQHHARVRRPVALTPAAGWDGHVHVFEATQRSACRATTCRPQRPLRTSSRSPHEHGIGHLVLVQPSVYGTDNAVMLRALRARRRPPPRRGGGRRQTSSDASWTRLHAAGVRGVRFNLVSPAGHGLAIRRATCARSRHGCASAAGMCSGTCSAEQLAQVAAWQATTGLTFVLDHLAGLHAGLRRRRPRLGPCAARWPGQGAWIKLSGWYRLGATAPYDALLPTSAVPPRCSVSARVWGSDWPHTSFTTAPPPGYDTLLAPVRAALGDTDFRALLNERAPRLYLDPKGPP